MDIQLKMQLYKEGIVYISSKWVKKIFHQKINTPDIECLIELIEIFFVFSGKRLDERSGFFYIKLPTRLLQIRGMCNVSEWLSITYLI